jgi:signal transduction histidine kinase
MLKFSFGLPKRSIKRLPSEPQVSDLQNMLTQAMEETDKDIGISWLRSSCEFKLVVRHRGSQLLWRLLMGSGLAAQVIWSTNETNLRTVFAQVLARCNDHADNDDGAADSAGASESPDADVITNSSVRRALSAFELSQGAANSHKKDTGKGQNAASEDRVHNSSGLTAFNNQQTASGTQDRNKPLPLLNWQQEGELGCVRMLHLLQSLIEAKACGRLTVIGPDDVAELFFYYGTIVDATASASLGDDAVLEVLCWESGKYHFDQTEQAERQSIHSSFARIMQKDMELLFQANELEEKGLRPSSFICRQRDKLAENALEELMQQSVPLKRIFLATSQPLTVAELVERVRLPRAQFLPALSGLMGSGLLMFWNEDKPVGPSPTLIGTIGGATQNSNGGSAATSQGMERFAFQQLIRAKPDAHDDLWLQALSTPGGLVKAPELEVVFAAATTEIPEECKQTARACFDFCNAYGLLFNRYIVDPELTITTSELGEVSEAPPAASKQSQGSFHVGEPPMKYYRWRSSTTLWSLNCRARENTVELYLVPARESVRLAEAEQDFRRKMKLDRVTTKEGSIWVSDGLPVMPADIRTFMRSCLRDLVRTTITDLQFEEYGYDETQIMAESNNSSQTSTYALQHMKQIIFEKQNLAQKIVSQQEEIQRRIARDLHDAVIADVTMLKRSLDGEARSNKADTIKSLEQIISRLREICYDLSPSDLKDWGLPTTIEALLDQVSHRTGAECELICHDEIPPLEGPVELHIFRILQEALNNSAKYAEASSISITTDMEESWLVFRVEDNGKGFDSVGQQAKATKDGGMGMGSMLERTQLIQCFYPAKLETRSHPGRGTVTRLAIKLPASVIATHRPAGNGKTGSGS